MGFPSRVTMTGVIVLRGRLPGPTALIIKTEGSEIVVEEDAGAWGDDARAEVMAEGLGDASDVSVAIDHDEVGGVAVEISGRC